MDEKIQTDSNHTGRIIRQEIMNEDHFEELKIDFGREQKKWNRNRRFVKREPTVNKELEEIKFEGISTDKEAAAQLK